MKAPNVTKLAASKDDLLILGEPGAGKRYLANQIHIARGKSTLIVIDGLTDANVDLEISGNTSLLLANIDALAPHNQAAVFSFLKKRSGYKNLKVIATAVSVDTELQEKLKAFQSMQIAPLRERAGEIPALTNSIVGDLCKKLGKDKLEIDDNALKVLSAGSWPGNVRELYNMLSKAVMISNGDSLELPEEFLNELQHLTDAIGNIVAGKNFVLDQSLDLIEKLLIWRTLKAYHHNQSKTAEILGLSEANFRYRLKKFKLPSVREVS